MRSRRSTANPGVPPAKGESQIEAVAAPTFDRLAAPDLVESGHRRTTKRSSTRPASQIDVDLLVAQLPLPVMPTLIESALQRMQEEMVPIPLAAKPQRELLSVDEAAEQLSISPKTLREAMSTRLKLGVHWHKFGARSLIDWQAVVDLVRSGKC